MSYSEKEKKFIKQSDEFITRLPFSQWASTWRYSFPGLFQQVLREYEKVYEIEYSESGQRFRKNGQKINPEENFEKLKINTL